VASVPFAIFVYVVFATSVTIVGSAQETRAGSANVNPMASTP
jgi:hypothetical protein